MPFRAALVTFIAVTLALHAADPAKHLNRSVQDVGGAVLVVSQFTLAGDCRKGRRPSFDEAAPPELARPLYTFERRLLTNVLRLACPLIGDTWDVALVAPRRRPAPEPQSLF